MTRGKSRLTDGARRGTLCVAAAPRKGVQMRAFWVDDHGQGMAEYALIIALIALVLLVTQVFFAGQIKNFFSNVGNALT